jgi:protocatechuate 3,4-dioxygenase beta subunit
LSPSRVGPATARPVRARGVGVLSRAFVAACLVTRLLWGAEHAPHKSKPVALAGFVRDDSGNPVKGAVVMVDQGSYTTRGEDFFIPIVTKKVVGGVLVDLPDVEIEHLINRHSKATDKSGHYSFKSLGPGTYNFQVRSFNHHRNYSVPPQTQITIQAGETTVRDVILHP